MSEVFELTNFERFFAVGHCSGFPCSRGGQICPESAGRDSGGCGGSDYREGRETNLSLLMGPPQLSYVCC